MRVGKTSSKTVVTMDIGAFEAKETVLHCPCSRTNFHSERLRGLAPEKGTFGFDVIVEAGLALFVRGRTNMEAKAELAGKNVFVSERQVGYLGGKFVAYLALAHRESAPRLRDAMERKGGYILHIDGTCEGDSPNLLCGLDGVSELVLDTVKIPSEKKELLVPFLRRVKKQYGDPRAIVNDMGRGIAAAVEEVFPCVPDYICHLDFFRRLQKVYGMVKDLAGVRLRDDFGDGKPFESVLKVLKDVAEDGLLEEIASSLESKAEVFDQLRTAMRIALPENKKGIDDTGEENDLQGMEERVEEFKNSLADDPEKKETYAKMIEQLENYWEKLFAGPLPVDTPEGTVYIQPQRTNNILERFFREEKRLGRKKTGTASLNKTLKAILSDTPLVRNLEKQEYVEIILDGCSDLAERFAEIDVRMVRKKLERSKKSNEKILPGIGKLIKNADLITKIRSVFIERAN